MEFSKREQIVLFGFIMSSADEKDLAERFSNAQLKKLEEVYTDFFGNTAPNKLKETTNSVVEKLLASVIGEESIDEQPTHLEGSE